MGPGKLARESARRRERRRADEGANRPLSNSHNVERDPLPQPRSPELEALGLGRAQLAIYRVLYEHRDEPLTMFEIRGLLRAELGDQEQLDRRRRDLNPFFSIERSRRGRDAAYRLVGLKERTESEVLGISERVRAQVLRLGRCEQCGRTPRDHGVRLQVDHKMPQSGAVQARSTTSRRCARNVIAARRLTTRRSTGGVQRSERPVPITRCTVGFLRCSFSRTQTKSALTCWKWSLTSSSIRRIGTSGSGKRASSGGSTSGGARQTSAGEYGSSTASRGEAPCPRSGRFAVRYVAPKQGKEVTEAKKGSEETTTEISVSTPRSG